MIVKKNTSKKNRTKDSFPVLLFWVTVPTNIANERNILYPQRYDGVEKTYSEHLDIQKFSRIINIISHYIEPLQIVAICNYHVKLNDYEHSMYIFLNFSFLTDYQHY
jgi:hypothetical protein